jgi:hypothetical protein
MISNAGEDIRHLSLGARRITDTIGRQQRQFQSAGNRNYFMVPRFFFAIEMPLQFGVDIFFAKDVDEFLGGFLCFSGCSVVKVFRQRPVFRARQAHQPVRVLRQFIPGHGALPRLRMLRHTQLHQSD